MVSMQEILSAETQGWLWCRFVPHSRTIQGAPGRIFGPENLDSHSEIDGRIIRIRRACNPEWTRVESGLDEHGIRDGLDKKYALLTVCRCADCDRASGYAGCPGNRSSPVRQIGRAHV